MKLLFIMNNKILELIDTLDNFKVSEYIDAINVDYNNLNNHKELLSKLETTINLLQKLTQEMLIKKQNISNSIDKDFETLKILHLIEPKTILFDYDNVKYDKIYIDECSFIDAIRVSSFDDVKQNGHIYYVEPNDHFAFYLNGRLYHGNIGEVGCDTKLKTCMNNECQYNTVKRSTCKFYHDPLIVEGSRDIRNYYSSYSTYKKTNMSPEYMKSRADKVVHDILVLHLRFDS